MGEEENRRQAWDLCIVLVKYYLSCTVHRNQGKEIVLGKRTVWCFPGIPATLGAI